MKAARAMLANHKTLTLSLVAVVALFASASVYAGNGHNHGHNHGHHQGNHHGHNHGHHHGHHHQLHHHHNGVFIPPHLIHQQQFVGPVHFHNGHFHNGHFHNSHFHNGHHHNGQFHNHHGGGIHLHFGK